MNVGEKSKMKTYRALAECAQQLEQQKQFYEASECWLKAANVARVYDNRVWAMRRAKFCQVSSMLVQMPSSSTQIGSLRHYSDAYQRACSHWETTSKSGELWE